LKTDLGIENKPTATQGRMYSLGPYVVVAAILLVLPLVVPPYFQSILGKIYIFAIFAMSLNIVMGYAGLMSIGHAVYLGIGGYTVGILMVRLGIDSIWILFPLALIASAIAAAIIGVIALRATGMHFIIITIAFGQLFYAIAVKWRDVTGSTDGLVGISFPSVDLFGFQWSQFSFHYLILACFIICYYLMYLITNSPFGHALVGIRENEQRMQGLGYNTWNYKYMAFIIGGIFAGLSGALFAPFYGIMAPGHFNLITSSMATLMVTLGSPGMLMGPIIGAVLVILIEFFASVYSPERWPLILGGMFVICITLFRGGFGVYLAGPWERLRKKIFK
jgi:branched-chain amino acid transport system permease protein